MSLRRCTIALALAAAAAGQAQPARETDPAPRNIIVFIADGAGVNTHRALELYRGEPALYRGDGWREHSVATYALRSGARPPAGLDPLEQDPRLVYDPARAFDTSPSERTSGAYAFPFEGYVWLLSTAPDSANTATAVFNGVSTYVGAIGVDGAGEPVPSAAEAAREQGKSVGVVSSVAFTHATPAAAAGAQVPSRDMYHEIAHQMLTSPACDVIAGAGHPEFDANASPRAEPQFTYIGPEDWSALRAGTLAPEGREPWTLVEDPHRIDSFASGDVPTPLMILPRVGSTLQQQREPRAPAGSAAPGEQAASEGVPTLRAMTLAALNAVDDDPDGFLLVVEGGGVDWAMHDNQMGRMLEEMADFHDAIEAVAGVLDSRDRGYDWSDTLVLVTGDHDHLLAGPDALEVPFQPLEDRGAGHMPGYRWLYNSHSNLPIPLFVRGPGSERFEAIPTERPDADHPPYFHQQQIGRVLHRLLGPPTADAPGEGAVAR